MSTSVKAFSITTMPGGHGDDSAPYQVCKNCHLKNNIPVPEWKLTLHIQFLKLFKNLSQISPQSIKRELFFMPVGLVLSLFQ